MAGAPVVDKSVVQGLLVSGYKHLRHARFKLFAVTEGAPASERAAWLRGLPVTSGDGKDKTFSLNLALTAAGLRAFGVDDDGLADFPETFTEGMTTPHRQRLLGDHTGSTPARWLWGRPDQVIHGVLLCYAVDPTELSRLSEQVEDGPVSIVSDPLETEWLPDAKEHFGFRDGMGQPEVRGLHKHVPGRVPIAPGELLLGHTNEYGERTHAPRVGGRDFGVDGTYLVMRQLQQHVGRFWEFVRRKSEEIGVGRRFPDADPTMLMAAKMVGRWPGGAPLALSPDRDDRSLATADNFGYADDASGMRCPLGSHVRRAHPRDWFLGRTPAESLAIANRHRILRRGRAYGAPLVPTMEPRALSRAREDNRPRGLMFLCLNANIERQFEVVQHNWLNNPKFGGLYGGADPVVGDHDPETSARNLPTEFLIPAEPLRCRVTELQRFVTVRGGAYFFMPSMPAVERLAGLAERWSPAAT